MRLLSTPWGPALTRQLRDVHPTSRFPQRHEPGPVRPRPIVYMSGTRSASPIAPSQNQAKMVVRHLRGRAFLSQSLQMRLALLVSHDYSR